MTIPSIQPSNLDSFAGWAPCPSQHDAQTARSTTKVLHVINGEHYSGAERVQDLLAARLPEFGYDVGFVCVKPGKFASARQHRATPLFELPMRSKFDWSVVRRICRIAKEGKYELLHAHTPRSALVARVVAALTRLPMIYHVHSPTLRDSSRLVHNWLNHWTERLSLTRIAALVTVSDSLRRHMLAQGFSPNRVFTVHNGVAAPARQRAATPPTGVWTLGMTALFRPRKGLEVLLDALAILHRENVPVRLRAVGPFESSEYERQIQARVAELGIGDRICWTGFTTDVTAELVQMDLFVLPSLFGEGLPMVVLEAMAAGVPVVATRVEGTPEAIEHGVSGWIAEPNDAASLAACLRSAIRGDCDWSAIRQCALLRHSKEFSDKQMAAGLAEVYRKVL